MSLPFSARVVADPAALAASLAALSRPSTVTVLDLGCVPFAPLAAVQAAYLELRRREPRQCHDVLLLLEHEPVITVSRRTNTAHIVWSAEERSRRGVALCEVDRGGDVTFHGPGQVVGYPLLDLTARQLGSAAYMHRLERTVLDTLATLGLAGQADPAMPGVWVDDPRHGERAKICAVGTRVSRGLTKHGFALNHTVALTWFESIIPCGLPRPVTSLEALLGPGAITRDELHTRLVTTFGNHFPEQPLHWHQPA